MRQPICCVSRSLNTEFLDTAALAAISENPTNAPDRHTLANLDSGFISSSIAMLTSKYWRTSGVRLTVGFLDNPEPALQKRILTHMNAWSRTGNITFVSSPTDPQVRITRNEPEHWSYVGTDILLIDANKPTMSLAGFTMNTPESEFYRVVRHETGHTLGCPHENLPAELIGLIDYDAAVAYYGARQGWSPTQVRAQLFTPIEHTSIFGHHGSQCSIMCHQIPGQLTKSGQPILGGMDISESDYDFIGRLYPKRSS